MNNKGFTLIELLAVIVLIGILSTVVIGSVWKYRDSAKDTSYATMEEVMYEAAQSYIIEKGVLFIGNNNADGTKSFPNPKYYYFNTTAVNAQDGSNVIDLYKLGYVNEMSDPDTKGGLCNGMVTVTRKDDGTKNNPKYEYKVELHCHKYNSPAGTIYPKTY